MTSQKIHLIEKITPTITHYLKTILVLMYKTTVTVWMDGWLVSVSHAICARNEVLLQTLITNLQFICTFRTSTMLCYVMFIFRLYLLLVVFAFL